MDLSRNIGNVSWDIEQMLRILLKDTEADLEQLHNSLLFFATALDNCKNDWQKHTITDARWIYLKNRYGIYIEGYEE